VRSTITRPHDRANNKVGAVGEGAAVSPGRPAHTVLTSQELDQVEEYRKRIDAVTRLRCDYVMAIGNYDIAARLGVVGTDVHSDFGIWVGTSEGTRTQGKNQGDSYHYSLWHASTSFQDKVYHAR
jgi:hypothetical protein